MKHNRLSWVLFLTKNTNIDIDNDLHPKAKARKVKQLVESAIREMLKKAEKFARIIQLKVVEAVRNILRVYIFAHILFLHINCAYLRPILKTWAKKKVLQYSE